MPQDDTAATWAALTPGTEITIVKRPWETGRAEMRYPGELVASRVPSPWLEFGCRWELPTLTLSGSGLVIEHGSVAREFFSPSHGYNAFGIFRRSGAFAGWYANVTEPARLTRSDTGWELVWQDLVLDVVMLPTGELFMMDDDELPAYHAQHPAGPAADDLIAARQELTGLLVRGFFPL